MDNILIYRSVDRRDVFRALDIVKAFIQEKKRILTGGMAIHLALEKAGREGIYGPDEVPDYDFFSPEYYEDAREIALRLCREGITRVGYINALHSTTMRVRVHFFPVADVTFVPPDIYERMPTLEADGMRIEAPILKYMNVHRALSLPFENMPFPPVDHRWKKDMQRYDLLYSAYPIKKGRAYQEVSRSDEIQEGDVLCGFAALSYWEGTANHTAFPVIKWKAPSAKVPLEMFREELPAKAPQYRHRFLDTLRECAEFPDQNLRIYRLRGWRLSAHHEKPHFFVANPQYLLAQFVLYSVFPEMCPGVTAGQCAEAYCRAARLVEKHPPSIDTVGDLNLSPEICFAQKKYLVAAGICTMRNTKPPHGYPDPPDCKLAPQKLDYSQADHLRIGFEKTTSMPPYCAF